ncbi:MAG TPA: DUF177 domain-containing protein [Capillimicrobium sp.]|nr:DUF177 domain-containing protein [Capillimicrobium sp.]
MAQRTDTLDLARYRLSAGEGRRIDDLSVALDGLEMGGQHYEPAPALEPVRLDVSRMIGGGYALRLRFSVALTGPCMRCLGAAGPEISVDAREVHEPQGDEDLELRSPYIGDGEVLDLHAWARDALVLALPNQVLCRPDCAGLCPECGADLNEAGPEHRHERAPDPRWAKLRDLNLGESA